MLGAGLAQAALGQLLGVTPLAWIYSAQLAGAPATVKVLRPELETEARRAAWAGLAERWGGARAGSPAILAGSALPEERAFLAFEVVRGEGLDRVLARGELPEAQRRGILRAIGRSLSEAHSAGVAHLDLRPSKVSLGRQALLVDLGLLATIGAGAPLRELLDPRYAAPEQADGALGDRASDVYQLALLACKVLYGRLPFSATRAEDFWELKLHAEPDLEGVPEQTRGAFARALARDPAARYPDAAACCQALGL